MSTTMKLTYTSSVIGVLFMALYIYRAFTMGIMNDGSWLGMILFGAIVPMILLNKDLKERAEQV